MDAELHDEILERLREHKEYRLWSAAMMNLDAYLTSELSERHQELMHDMMYASAVMHMYELQCAYELGREHGQQKPL